MRHEDAILTALLAWYWNVYGRFAFWHLYRLSEEFVSFIAQNSARRRQSTNSRLRRRHSSRTRNRGIKLRKRSARRKQVRKISFPLNDEEGRGGSQRVLFPICGCPLHRWSKLAAKCSWSLEAHSRASPRSFHAPSPLHDCRCGASSGDQSSSPAPWAFLRKYDLRNSIRQRQLRASRTSRMRESASEWRTPGDNSERRSCKKIYERVHLTAR